MRRNRRNLHLRYRITLRITSSRPPYSLRGTVVALQRQGQRSPRVHLGRLHAEVELYARYVLVAIERRRQRSHRLALQVITRAHVIAACNVTP